MKLAILACGAIAALAVLGSVRARADEPASSGGDIVVRRLDADQYRRIIANIFGSGIEIGGRFEPEIRTDGLLAVGAAHVSVTASGLEQYDAMARTVAAQIVDDRHRDMLIPCKPASETAPDDACAGQFIAKAGRLLYRRPLTSQELQTRVSNAAAAAKALKSFYTGLGQSLAGMLESPQFLFREERAEPEPAHPGQYRVDVYAKASRLSFLLWDTAPDLDLIAAAESGALNTEKGLAAQVDRMLASPRLEAGVRAFFTDFLGFDEFATLSKDTTIYPKFTNRVADDAKEQTLRTIVDLLLARRGDYRELFTTRRTFLTPPLGSLYGVPVAGDVPNGAPQKWLAREYPEGDPRAGILMQASFSALHSHPGRTSPTERGRALREIVLCEKVPDPPPNVDFTVVQDTTNPQYKTARERLTAHRTDPVCAGCHKLIDPIGLAMENFDSAGGYRTAENGVPINAAGNLDGVEFGNAAGLSKAVHDDSATALCLVNRLYAYAVGRPPAPGEAQWMKYLEQGFAADGYRIPDLLRRIAVSDAFYRVSRPGNGP